MPNSSLHITAITHTTYNRELHILHTTKRWKEQIKNRLSCKNAQLLIRPQAGKTTERLTAACTYIVGSCLSVVLIRLFLFTQS